MTPPEGLLIGGSSSGKTKWRIGRELGSGACGSVHELTNGTSSTKYVVKITPLPPPCTNLKKKKSAAQKNADLLYYESLMYQTHFSHLRGTHLPNIPYGSKEPPFFQDEHGFRYLTMERMERPLSDVVSMLQPSRRGGKTIAFGPIACSLVDCMQEIHDGRYVFVDVKPDNFMFAFAGKGPLESRIRMIDLGLLKPLSDTSGKHKQNEGSQLVGTPLYSSLHVHEGHTLSRRDDLEALGYVLCELLLGLVRKTDAKLPWSHGNSDDHIYRMKKEQVQDQRSTLYTKLATGGNGEVARIMFQYFGKVQGMTYKEKPSYEQLKELLSDLNVVTATTTTVKKATPKKATPKKTPTRASKRTVDIDLDDAKEEDFEVVTEATSKKARASKRTSTTPKRTRKNQLVIDLDDSEDEDYELRVHVTRSKRRSSNKKEEDCDSDKDAARVTGSKKRSSPRNKKENGGCDEDVAPAKARRIIPINDDDFMDTNITVNEQEEFESCQDGESMDWEAVPDENQAPTNKSVGVKMVFVGGPHEGESFLLTKDSDTIILGSNPKPKSGDNYRFDKDEEVDPAHTKLVLFANKQMCSVKVIDLKSSTGTFVNGKKIPKGKDRQAFVNETIQLGDSTLKIHKLSASDSSTPKKKKAATSVVKKKTSRKDPPKEETRSSSLGVRIEIISGPHEGESFVLNKDGAETVVVGSNPKTKSGETYYLNDDATVNASHAKLELCASKKLCTVKVTNLNSDQGGTCINGQAIGKHRRAFINDRIEVGQTVLQIKRM